MNKIQEAVELYKVEFPHKKNQDIAKELFPELSETRAREKLSRWTHGHEIARMNLNELETLCGLFKLKPSEVIADFEKQSGEALRVKDVIAVCERFNLNPKELLNNYE